MKKSPKIRVVIPAAGKGVRSGLSYPKCLYRINGEPILIRLCKKMINYDEHPIIIINPEHQFLFDDVMKEYRIIPEYVYQEVANGMGGAVLCADRALSQDDTVLLLWSDIPLLSDHTIRSLLNCHTCALNDFSFVSSLGQDCYTIVKRENGKVVALLETKALKMQPLPYGERDIGLFIFYKEPVFELLREGKDRDYRNGVNEHGFLNLVESLVVRGKRVEAYPIAMRNDVLSFNSPEDLINIDEVMRLNIT